MQASDIPDSFPIAFGQNALASDIRSIPTNPSGQTGAASLSGGFPHDNFIPVAAGGVPPFGADVNGILFQATGWNRWLQAGGPLTYDATFQAAIGGYPKGALIQSLATFGVFWLSTAEDNLTDPDAGGAGWVAIPIPGLGGGVTRITASGDFIVPDGVSVLKRIRLWGPGGGGRCVGSGHTNAGNGSGGGSGAHVEHVNMTVTPGASMAAVVGTGGASNANGSAATTFNGLSAGPGLAGLTSAALGPEVEGGQAGAASGGNVLNISGQPGQPSCQLQDGVDASIGQGSPGGNAPLGGLGGIPYVDLSAVSRINGGAPGGGGAGVAYFSSRANHDGGTGGDGLIIIEY